MHPRVPGDPPAGDPRRQHAGSRVTGAGTLLSAEREPLVSDIDLDVDGDAPEALELVTAALEAAGAPKGSRVRLGESGPVPFGVTEGLAVYLNGTDLPGEVYASSDIDELIAALSGRPRQRGRHAVLVEGPARNGAVPVRPVRRPHGRADRRRPGPVPSRPALPRSSARTHTALQKLTCERDAPAGTLRPVGGQVSTFPAQVVPRQVGDLGLPQPNGPTAIWPVRSRCLQPGQQHGRRWPSSSSSWVRRMRRSRVTSCLASSTQQMNSLRAKGVMSFQASSDVALTISASRRSAGSLWTTPPGTL